jgi:uncharacterized protein (DUF1800 family)
VGTTRTAGRKKERDLLRPIPASEWGTSAAAHLARRAGFGGRPEEIAELAALGPELAVESFLAVPDRDEALEARIESLGGDLAVRGETGVSSYEMTERLREWWLYRMVETRHPLQEKLTLFWHDRFACQESKVLRDPLILQQNELFRHMALGSFQELLVAVARDAAMLVFLDNRLSERANPNENWARELLELFSLGIDHYTQADVVALARVFTGWTTPDERSTEFRFDPELHDGGEKLFLGARIEGRSGEAGLAEGVEAIQQILAQPAAARFLARELCTWFVGHDPDPRAVEELAGILVETDWSVRETLRVLFLSRWFHASEQRFAMIRNPVELVVSAGRLLGVQNVHRGGFARILRAMGMQLFEPPSVAGWEHGQAWIGSSTTIERLALALSISELPHSQHEVVGTSALDLDSLAPPEAREGALVDALVERLLQRPIPAAERAALVGYLAELDKGLEAGLDPKKRRRAEIRALVHLVLASPRFAVA